MNDNSTTCVRQTNRLNQPNWLWMAERNPAGASGRLPLGMYVREDDRVGRLRFGKHSLRVILLTRIGEHGAGAEDQEQRSEKQPDCHHGENRLVRPA